MGGKKGISLTKSRKTTSSVPITMHEDLDIREESRREALEQRATLLMSQSSEYEQINLKGEGVFKTLMEERPAASYEPVEHVRKVGLFKSEKVMMIDEDLQKRDELRAKALNAYLNDHDTFKHYLELEYTLADGTVTKEKNLDFFYASTCAFKSQVDPEKLITPEKMKKLTKEEEVVKVLRDSLSDLMKEQGKDNPDEKVLEGVRAALNKFKINSQTIGDEEILSNHSMDSRTRWVFLMQIVTKGLFDRVNKLNYEDVDKEELIKLYSMSRNFDYAASAMFCSKAYIDAASKVKEITEEDVRAVKDMKIIEDATRKAEERRLTRENRAKFIREGRSADGKHFREWNLAPYADAIIEKLTESGAIDADEKEFSDAVMEYRDRVAANMRAIESYVAKAAAGISTSVESSKSVRESVAEKICELCGKDMFLTPFTVKKEHKAAGESSSVYTDVLTSEAAATINGLYTHPDVNAIRSRVVQRLNKLVDELSGGEEWVKPIASELLMSDERLMRVVDRSSDSVYRAEAKKVLAALDINLKYLQTSLLDMVNPDVSEKVGQSFTRKYWRLLMTASTGTLYAKMSDFLTHISVYEPEISRLLEASSNKSIYKTGAAPETEEGQREYCKKRVVEVLTDRSSKLGELFDAVLKGREGILYECVLEAAKSGEYSLIGLEKGAKEADILALSSDMFEFFLAKVHKNANANANYLRIMSKYDCPPDDKAIINIFVLSGSKMRREYYMEADRIRITKASEAYCFEGFYQKEKVYYAPDSAISSAKKGQTRANRRAERLNNGRAIRESLLATEQGTKIYHDMREKLLSYIGAQKGNKKIYSSEDYAEINDEIYKLLSDYVAPERKSASVQESKNRAEISTVLTALDSRSRSSKSKWIFEVFLGDYEQYFPEDFVETLEKKESEAYASSQLLLAQRLMQAETLFEAEYVKVSNTTKVPAEVMKRVRPAIMRLSELDDEKELAGKLSELSRNLYEYIVLKKHPRVERMEANRDARIMDLKAEFGDTIEIFLPVIYADKEIMIDLCRGWVPQFTDLVKRIKENVIEPLKALGVFFNDNMEMIQGFLKLHGKTMLSEKKTVSEWKDIFTEYRGTVISSNDGEIEKNMEAILKVEKGTEYYDLHNIAGWIVSTEPLSTFRDKKKFKEVMKGYLDFEKRITEILDSNKAMFERWQDSKFKKIYTTKAEIDAFSYLFRRSVIAKMISEAGKPGETVQTVLNRYNFDDLHKVWDYCLELEQINRSSIEKAREDWKKRDEARTKVAVRTRVAQEERQKELEAYTAVAQKVRKGIAPMKDFEKQMNTEKPSPEYIEKREALGKLRHIRKDCCVYPYLRTEYIRFEMEASYSLFTEKTDDFVKRLTGKISFFNSMIELSKRLAAHQPAIEEKYLNAIMEYFRAQIKEAPGFIDSSKFTQELEELLADEYMMEYLLHPESIYDSVDIHTIEERGQLSSDSGQSVRDLIENSGTQEQKTGFAGLGLEEQKIFALILSVPQLVAAKEQESPIWAIFDKAKDELALTDAREAVLRYSKGEALTDKISYSDAYDRLAIVGADGKVTVNEDAFEKALNLTLVCRKNRIANTIDYDKIGAVPMESIRLVRKGKTSFEQLYKTKEAKGHIEGSPEWIATLLDKSETHKPKGVLGKKKQKLLEAIRGFSTEDAKVFIRALQNRTVLDLSFKESRWDRAKGAITEHVNEEGRQELISELASSTEIPEGMSAGIMIENAMLQLCGFRFKEDTLESQDRLRVADIEESSLARKTFIDWDLLDEAIKFTDEVRNERLKREALSHSADEEVIMQSGCTAAIDELEKLKNNPTGTVDIISQGDYESFIIEQAKANHQEELLAGYLLLSDEEKTLFFNAIANRTYLDISKENINLNRLGLTDRDFVDKEGRDALIDEFIEKGSLPMSEELFRRATLSSLSVQLIDSADFGASDFAYADSVTSKSWKFKKPRETAVDWKLFERAIQLVTRARNEKKITDDETQMYRVYGDAMKTGEYVSAKELFRGNIHNSGYAFFRMLGSTAADIILDDMPAYVQTGIRLLLPVEASNVLNSLKPFEADDDEGSILSKVTDSVDFLNTYLNEDHFTPKIIEALGVMLKQSDKVAEVSDFVKDTSETVETVKTLIDTAKSTWDLVDIGITMMTKASKSGEAAQKESKMLADGTATLSEKEQQRTREAAGNISRNLSSSVAAVSQEKVFEIIDNVSELITEPFEKLHDVIGPIILQVATKSVEQLVGFFTNHARIRNTYSISEALESYKNVLKEKAGIDWNPSFFSVKAFCTASGFESEQEMGEILLMNMAHSLLFAASTYNTAQPRQRLIAMLCLNKLGLGTLVSQTSEEAAMAVYEKLRGENRY